MKRAEVWREYDGDWCADIFADPRPERHLTLSASDNYERIAFSVHPTHAAAMQAALAAVGLAPGNEDGDDQ